MVDLADKTLRLYEDCSKCEGSGWTPELIPTGKETSITVHSRCSFCDGKGSVTTYVKFSEMKRAIQEIAKAAVRQVLAERSGETKRPIGWCPECETIKDDNGYCHCPPV